MSICLSIIPPNELSVHKRQAIRVWPHSEIFAGPGARKNACWGASPNPALWDKMSQRGWLRHRRYRAGSLFVC